MPRGDGTGPMGQESTTGRGLGCYARNANSGFGNVRFGYFGLGRGGRAYGCGMGRGFGFSNRPRFGNVSYEDSEVNQNLEKNYLKEDIEALESELLKMKKHLSELEKEDNNREQI